MRGVPRSDGNADDNAGELVRLTANDRGVEARNPYSWRTFVAVVKPPRKLWGFDSLPAHQRHF